MPLQKFRGSRNRTYDLIRKNSLSKQQHACIASVAVYNTVVLYSSGYQHSESIMGLLNVKKPKKKELVKNGV